MKIKYLTTIIVVWLALCANANGKFCVDEDLARLDQAVAQKSKYDQAKQKEIARLRLSEGNYLTPVEKYTYQESLYREYLKWNPDSAITHARECERIALDNGFSDLYKKACIQEAYVKTICGELLDAALLIQNIGKIEELNDENKVQMSILMLEFGLRRKMVGFDATVTNEVLEIWNKYSAYMPKDNWRYDYYNAMLTRSGSADALLAQLKRCKQPSFEAAAISIGLSVLYKRQKDKNACYHYLILSAINDIECANNEASSLIYIINSSYLKLSPKQAFGYAMVCTENAKYFKDKGRSLDVVDAYAKIAKDYQEASERRMYMLYGIIGLLAAAIIVICLLSAKLAKREKQQKLLLHQLAESNASLEEMVDKEKSDHEKLQESNRRLQEEIGYRNRNFFNVYQLLSKYIADVQEFKKKMFNLTTAGKYEKVRQELGSNAHTDKYLKEFFDHFDQSFLVSHPDFVERFNELLRPECRITPPAKNMLTPELRIYALLCLGITDSVSIAQFLHYSPQTVYNYRLKVRRSACIDERVFADTVAKMYEQKE